jgi:hypothetical protein
LFPDVFCPRFTPLASKNLCQCELGFIDFERTLKRLLAGIVGTERRTDSFILFFWGSAAVGAGHLVIIYTHSFTDQTQQ